MTSVWDPYPDPHGYEKDLHPGSGSSSVQISPRDKAGSFFKQIIITKIDMERRRQHTLLNIGGADSTGCGPGCLISIFLKDP